MIATTCEANHICFEMWHGNRKLTLYVEAGYTHFIKVWGPDVQHHMIDGIVGKDAQPQELWDWLYA